MAIDEHVGKTVAFQTPRRACKDVALARLLTPFDLQAPLNVSPKSTPIRNRKPRVSHRFTDRSVSSTISQTTPTRRLRSLSISVKPSSNPLTIARRRPTSGYASNDGQASPDVDANDSDCDAELSSSSESTETSDDTSDSDSSNSSEWTSKRRRRGRPVKCTPGKIRGRLLTVNTASASRLSKPTQHFLPKRTASAQPNNRPVIIRSHIAVDGWLPGRQYEFETIYSFIVGKMQQNIGGCMYISGLPGTGKTASVNAVLATLFNRKDQLSKFQKILVNGMQVDDPRQVYVQVYQQLTGQLVPAKRAATLLEKEFCSPPTYRFKQLDIQRAYPVVLVIDELDLLCTKRQDVLYNLFDWPTGQRGRCLIVLAIANTMDLPERMLHPRVASRLGLTRLTFSPYSHEQLALIVKSRLAGTFSNSFQDKALELASRKVAAVSGDVRRALDICRRAVEMAAQSNGSREIGITHVNGAIKEMFATPKVNAIQACSLYEKLFLRALVAEFHLRSTEEARLIRCIQQMSDLCRIEGFTCPTNSEVFDICSSLGAYKLLITEPSRRDTSMLVRLNCSKADVLFALKTQAVAT